MAAKQRLKIARVNEDAAFATAVPSPARLSQAEPENPRLAKLPNNASFALSIADFCAAYSIGRTLAYEEIAAGRLRAKKAGSRTLILQRDAQAWAESLPTLADSAT